MSGLAIGIASRGRSSTVGVVSDSRGDVLGVARTERLTNFNESDQASLAEQVYQLLRQLLTPLQVSVAKFLGRGCLCVGLSGVTTAHDRNCGLPSALVAADLGGLRVVASGDAEVAMCGATGKAHACVLIAGPGAIALANSPSGCVRVGGWGPVLGDEGSGYWIGRRALQEVCRVRDGRSVVGEKLSTYLRTALSSVTEISDLLGRHTGSGQDWIDALLPAIRRCHHSRGHRYLVAGLAAAVFACLRDNPTDLLASSIVSEASSHLAEQALVALKTARLERPTVALIGGVFRHNLPFAQGVASMIAKAHDGCSFVMPQDARVGPPAIGALMFALTGERLVLPSSEIVDRVRRTSIRFHAEISGDIL